MKGIALTTLTTTLTIDGKDVEKDYLDIDIQVAKDKNKQISRGLVLIDDSIDQEATLLLQLNQGDLKEDPLMGCNLVRYIQSNATKSEILRTMKIQFKRAELNFDDFKNRMTLLLNQSTNKETITVD